MAENDSNQEKTEHPTPKRLEEARKKGQVVTSREVTTWFMILSSCIVVIAFLPSITHDTAVLLTFFVEKSHEITLENTDLILLFSKVIFGIFKVLIIPFLIFVITPIIANYLQHGMIWSIDPIVPKFSKISPVAGFKRIFSLRALIEFTKGLFKLLIVGLAVFLIIYPQMNKLPLFIDMSLKGVLSELKIFIAKLFGAVLAIMGIVAVIDFMYQRYDHFKKLRMTKQEVKDETKQAEGDPIVKSRIRQIRQEKAKQRMMSAVPQADVIITNPTHFSVALKYDIDNMAAPRIVAKGADALAFRIREIAKENDIPLVEKPPLARALYKVEIDQDIPFEHYKAVAEIISYVWKLKGKMS